MLPNKLVKFTKNQSDIKKLVNLLLAGEILAAPTETAYGLLAVAINQTAVRNVYKIKGREINKPCPVIMASLAQAKKYFYFNGTELKLANKFWPGPLTLVLKPKKNIWPKEVANKQGKVGVRVPGSLWLRTLLLAVGKPLTATSANIAGQPTLYSYQLVVRSLYKRGLKYVVAACLQPKPTSTVTEVNRKKINIYRLGAISERRLLKVLN